MPTAVVAAEKTGSIRVIVKDQGVVLSNGTVELYAVSEDNLTTDPVEQLQILRLFGATPMATEPILDGVSFFGGLECGYYLVAQGDAPDGYLPMSPFYVSIPIRMGNQSRYDVEAFPKLRKIPQPQLPQTGQLIWPTWGLAGGGLLLTGLGFCLKKRK